MNNIEVGEPPEGLPWDRLSLILQRCNVAVTTFLESEPEELHT